MRTGQWLNGGGPDRIVVLQVAAATRRRPRLSAVALPPGKWKGRTRNEEPETSGEGGFGQTHLLPRRRPYVRARVGGGAVGAASGRAGSQPAAAAVPLLRPGGRGPRRVRARFVLLAEHGPGPDQLHRKRRADNRDLSSVPRHQPRPRRLLC